MLSGNAAGHVVFPLGHAWRQRRSPASMEALIKPTLALIRADVGLKGKGRLRGRQKCIQADARWRQTYSLHAGCRNPFGLDPLRAAQAALETGEDASNWNGHRNFSFMFFHFLHFHVCSFYFYFLFSFIRMNVFAFS